VVLVLEAEKQEDESEKDMRRLLAKGSGGLACCEGCANEESEYRHEMVC
jgi:hypothetical protein